MILFKIPINQLSQIYIDQSINIDKEKFYKIIYDLNRYENILLDLNNPVEELQIRRNLNEILINTNTNTNTRSVTKTCGA